VIGAASAAAALLVVAAGYFAVTEDRTDTVVAVDAPSESTSGPLSPAPSTPRRSNPSASSTSAPPNPADTGGGAQPGIVGAGAGAVAPPAPDVQGKAPVGGGADPAQNGTSPLPQAPVPQAAPPQAAPPRQGGDSGGSSGGSTPVPVAVPSVVGLALPDAETRLTGAGFTVGTITTQTVTTTNQDGIVLSQNPTGQTPATTGSTVNLTVGKIETKPTPTIPSVVGLTLPDARTKLTNAGYTVGTITTQTVTTTNQDGIVLSQNPTGQTPATTGSTVNLTVGKVETKPVPDVVGLALADARTRVTNAGFTVSTTTRTVTSAKQDGVVLAQTPTGQTQARPGSTVTLTIGKIEETKPPPNVVGLTLADARSRLSSAGFTVGTVSYANDTSTAAGGTVLRQGAPDATKAVDLVVKNVPIG
jgi:beta-lactam-binding protein with PASTA domain